jgi:hypothetical protein
VYANRDPQQRKAQEQRPHRALRLSAALAGWLVVVLAVCGGVGWLYLLRNSAVLDAGPHLKGALPLEGLAAGDAQPLLRMALAWLPAGVAAGVALGVLTRIRVGPAVAGCTALGLVILGVTTTASEALIHNERVSRHIGGALGRSGLWAAVGFIAVGSFVGAALARGRSPRAASAVAGRTSVAP